jgi:hypothetical protein
MKRLKKSQKLRIILSGVAIYTTAQQIRYGLFGFMSQNAAAQKALEALEFQGRGATGLAGTWEGLQVQIDLMS